MSFLTGYRMSDEEKKRLESEINSLVDSVNNEISDLHKVSSEEAIKKLLNVQNLLLPKLLSELKSSDSNLYRTKVIDKTSSLISKMLDASIKLREFEIKEDIDVINNPKIHLMFKWFMDSMSESWDEMELSIEDRNKFFDIFSNKLDGWEAKVEQRLKKLSFKDILSSHNIESPLKVYKAK